MTADKITERLGDCVLIPIPKGEKGPKFQGWQNLTLWDMTEEHLATLEDCNIGVSLGQKSKGLITIDADKDEYLEAFLSVNPALRESLITNGARGGNVWLRIEGEFPKSSKVKCTDGSPWGEFRADGNQTVISGIHPSGVTYQNNGKTPLKIAFADIKWPEGLRVPWNSAPLPIQEPVPYIRGHAVIGAAKVLDRARAYVAEMPAAVSGQGGHHALFAVCKVLCHDFDLSEADAWSLLADYNARCQPPWTEAELRHKLEDASKCDRARRARGELAQPRQDFYTARQRYELNERNEKRGASFVNSFFSFEVETPTLADEALHGVPGEIVRKIEPHTETHPAAILLQLLIGFGNMVGRNPYFVTERDRQYANLFGVIVGASSRGRKGTSWSHAKSLLKEADPEWEASRIMSGVASGEGVIMELKDAEAEEETPTDKRLLLVETEFASVLNVTRRDNNTVSATLRNAWDTGVLGNLANKNRNSKGAALRASGCHISVIAHITQYELNKLLDAKDAANGFANRFLWVYSSRTKLLPDGGNIGEVCFKEEIKWLQEAIKLAQGRGEMKRTPEARDYWHFIYPNLTADNPGRWGQVTSRGEAQVVRLSLVFALFDGGSHIALEHLKAAEAVWNYCNESARWAFMESRYSDGARKILAALQSGPKTLSDISKVFNNNSTEALIQGYLSEIKDLITIETQETAGRWVTIIRLKEESVM